MRGSGGSFNASFFLSLVVAVGCGGGGSTSASAGVEASTGGGEPTTTGGASGASTSGGGTTGETSGATTGSGGLSDTATTGGGDSSTGADASTSTATSESTSTGMGTGSTSGGMSAVCGDGLVESPEMCEPGEPDCLDDCTYPPGHVFWTDIVPGIQAKSGARGWGAAFDADDVPLALMSRGGPGGGSFIKKYTRDGAEVWSKLWSSDAFPNVIGYALTLQPDGSPVLVGQFADAQTGNDAFVGRMSADGAVGWGLQYELEPNEWFEDALGLPDGSIVAVGSRNSDPVLDDRGWIVKVSPTGVAEWQDDILAPMHISALEEAARLADGRIVVFGCCLAGGESLLRAYQPDGAVAWTTALPQLKNLGFGGAAMTVDHNHDIVAISRTESAFWIGKYTADGAEVWEKTVDDPALALVFAKAMVATPQGRYVFGGYADGFQSDLVYGALDGDGAVLWTEVIAGAGKQHDMIHNLAVDSRGVVLAAGLLNDGEYRAWIRMFAP